MTHWSKSIPRGACGQAMEWSRTQPSLAIAWQSCRRGDWMLWLLGRCGADRRLLVKAAALCAEPAAALCDEYTEAVGLSVVQTCVAWSEGAASDEELRAAAMAEARAAAAAVAASWAADAAAAWAARAAAAWAATRAADAASTVAEAAARAASASRAWSLAHSADIVRGVFPAPPKLTRKGTMSRIEGGA